MTDLRELYQEVILDHNNRPRNFGQLADATAHAEGHNPLCGDNLTVYVRMEGDAIAGIAFVGSGCAISKASASMMTQALKGKTKAEAERIYQQFHKMVTDQDSEPDAAALGKLAVFSGVREFPARVKCASLAWHTVKAVLDGEAEPVTTE